jgi:hypothetical protein
MTTAEQNRLVRIRHSVDGAIHIFENSVVKPGIGDIEAERRLLKARAEIDQILFNERPRGSSSRSRAQTKE